MMHKKVELPLVEPLFQTYQYQSSHMAIIHDNPTIRNWYLTELTNLACDRQFLNGFTTPRIQVPKSNWEANPHIEKIRFPMKFANGYIHPIIRNLLDNGYYVYFGGVDDYYIKGKTFYGIRHFAHDGLICGYNQVDKSYCVYSYDENWVCRKFWTPQKAFIEGGKASLKKDVNVFICGLKSKQVNVPFLPETACAKIEEYLDSSLEKYPKDQEGMVYGIVVQEYMADYVNKLIDGSIPYDRMDKRVFRVIWEHKKAMLERLQMVERMLHLGTFYSEKYRSLVNLSNSIRMMYASHSMKRRDLLLHTICENLLRLQEEERDILTAFTDTVKRGIKE